MQEIRKVAVIGSGTMGSSIAQWFVQAGCLVELTDQNLDFLKASGEKIFKSWDKLEGKGKFTPDQTSHFKESLALVSFDDFSKDADLVIEAIIEDLKVKQELFQRVFHHFYHAIAATNTSSLSISDICAPLSGDLKKNAFLDFTSLIQRH